MSQPPPFPNLPTPQPTPQYDSTSSILLAPLNELQAISQALFLSLGPPHTKPPPPPPLSAVLACDEAISSAIDVARLHQFKQARIEALTAEIAGIDVRWKDICMELELGKRDLEVLLEDSEERIKAIEQASSASVPYPELLAYAQRLSAFTAAPPNLPDDNSNLYGQEPQPLFFPPFPNEEKMRRGRLNAEAPLALLGEVHSVGKAQTTTPGLPDSQLPGHGINPYRRETRPTAPQATFDFDLDLNPDF